MKLTPWPRATFQNRHGDLETGDVAYECADRLVIRVYRPPKLVSTAYGLKLMAFSYEEVDRKYVIATP